MTALKSEVVSRRVLSKIGQAIGLFSYIHIDTTNMRTFNDRSKDSLCTDVLEALIGAIHIDQGPDVARDFVARTILPIVSHVNKQTSIKEAGRLAAREALEILQEQHDV